MKQIAMAIVTTVLSGLMMICVIFFILPPVLGPILIGIVHLPWPLDDVAWLVVVFPLVVLAPPALWFGIYWLVSERRRMRMSLIEAKTRASATASDTNTAFGCCEIWS